MKYDTPRFYYPDAGFFSHTLPKRRASLCEGKFRQSVVYQERIKLEFVMYLLKGNIVAVEP